MNSMRSNVAKAIAEKLAPALSGGKPVTAREIALVAIEAMREPTDTMLDAGMDWHKHVSVDETYPSQRGTYRAMIDAALKEE